MFEQKGVVTIIGPVEETNCWKLPGRQGHMSSEDAESAEVFGGGKPGNPQPDAQAQRLCGE